MSVHILTAGMHILAQARIECADKKLLSEMSRYPLWNGPLLLLQTFQRWMFRHSSPAYQPVPASPEPTWWQQENGGLVTATTTFTPIACCMHCMFFREGNTWPALSHFPPGCSHWKRPQICRAPPAKGWGSLCTVKHHTHQQKFPIQTDSTLTCLSLIAHFSTSFFAWRSLTWEKMHMHDDFKTDLMFMSVGLWRTVGGPQVCFEGRKEVYKIMAGLLR